MLKLINFKKLTAKTLIGILMVGGLVGGLSKKAVADDSPDSITLTGTLRDFRGYRDKNGNINPNGHEDFERKHNTDTNPSGQKFKYGLDRGITTDTLGADKKPIYAGGSYSTTTQANFDQWYRDVSGVNQSMSYDIELTKEAGSNIYSFDNNGNQFFPINGLLLGNEGRNHNFHFTFEIHTQFTYQGGETFNFSGDDDVWVYIDGQKVIDIGGVHGKTNASVNLDSLGLTPGETYDLDFFFAERHVTQSNFKIETTLELETAVDPDADEDNDGIPNILEGSEEETPTDSDGDGTPDYEEVDSDNNGVLDEDEVGTIADPSDSDGDQIPNFQDTDDDGNGILDVDEIGDPNSPDNFDGTDLPDYQDTDDDNDNILDVDEMGDDPDDPTDTDDDDLPDYQDTDSDDDGVSDEEETGDDTDGDGAPNFQDWDSDNPDASTLDDIEDPDYVGLPDDVDADPDNDDNDGDGILDDDEINADADSDGESDVEAGDLPEGGTLDDVDGDGIPNDEDTDSDNDGVSDELENENDGSEPYIKYYAD
ncbi:MAG: fibro-slime domain-containing protein [Cyanobacteria bacterium P01_G01_bin.19]